MASENKALEQFNTFVDTKFIPLDKNIKLAILIVLIVLPIGLYYFFAYTENVEQIETLNNKKSGLEREITKARKAASELDKIKASIAETQALFRETATVLPKEKEIPGLLTNISDLGKRAALEFRQFRPGGEKPKDFYAEIPVNISIRGPYHNVGYFLDKVSKLERIVTVNNIKLAGPKKSGNEMILNTTLTLVTYRFTGVQQAPPPKRR